MILKNLPTPMGYICDGNHTRDSECYRSNPGCQYFSRYADEPRRSMMWYLGARPPKPVKYWKPGCDCDLCWLKREYRHARLIPLQTERMRRIYRNYGALWP